jgi:hypothetical protein
MMGLHGAGSVVMALMLAGCAAEPFAAQAPAASAGMPGRWILSAPNAPSCGMGFEGEPGAQQGTVQPEGGCPGNLFMSRHWALAQNTLTIADGEERPLATLTLAKDRFQGTSSAGVPITLAR